MAKMDEPDRALWEGEDLLIPAFQLPSTEGRPLGPREFRHRRNLILLFLREASPPSSQGLLKTLARWYPKLKALQAEVLVVVPGEERAAWEVHRQLRLPFPFLFDPQDRVAPLCLGAEPDRPAVLLLDRYNVPWVRLEPRGEGELEIREAADWLEFIGVQCPECGVPDQPSPSQLASLKGGRAEGKEGEG
jgi:peroxiredoxin